MDIDVMKNFTICMFYHTVPIKRKFVTIRGRSSLHPQHA